MESMAARMTQATDAEAHELNNNNDYQLPTRYFSDLRTLDMRMSSHCGPVDTDLLRWLNIEKVTSLCQPHFPLTDLSKRKGANLV